MHFISMHTYISVPTWHSNKNITKLIICIDVLINEQMNHNYE